jgi:hypothetical protein
MFATLTRFFSNLIHGRLGERARHHSIILDASNNGYSTRVAEVAAICLRTLARVKLGIDLAEANARELALVYQGLEGAIKRLELLSNVQSGIGSKAFADRLSIPEALLTSRLARGAAIQAVIELRRQAFKSRQQASQAVQAARKNEFQLDAINKEIRDWSKNSREFRESLNSLFNKTRKRLDVLGLNPQEMTTAVEELNGIMLRALTRY